MWEIELSNQIFSFFISLIIGCGLSLIYSILHAFVYILNRPAQEFSTDIVFWLFSAVITFMLFIAKTNGELRIYLIIGESIGFLIFYSLTGRFFVRFFLIIFRVIYVFICRISLFIQKICEKTLILTLKSIKIVKKLLKNTADLLYTVICKHKVEKK